MHGALTPFGVLACIILASYSSIDNVLSHEINKTMEMNQDARNETVETLSAPKNQSLPDIMAIVTSASPETSIGLKNLLSDVQENSGSIKVIVFSFGLSASNITDLEARYLCEFRTPPNIPKTCKVPCKSLLVYTVIQQYDVIVWADIGTLPAWDFRTVLDIFPVGTTFAGDPSSAKLPKPAKTNKEKGNKSPEIHSAESRVISTRFFVLFVDLKFHNRVLLPWMKCSQDRRCPISPVTAKYASSLPRKAIADSWDDVLLTHLLSAFEAAHPGSVFLNASATPRPHPPQSHHPPRPALPRLGLGPLPDGPLIICLPLYGPNNQVVMLLHCARVAARLGARLLVPPIRPHYVKTDRSNVSQKPPELPPDGLFSHHFLYRHALLADSDSSWEGLLPSLQIVVTDQRHAPPCFAIGSCTIADLMTMQYPRVFLQTVGATRAPAAAIPIRVAPCPSDPEACARASVGRGLVPLLLWNTIGLLQSPAQRSTTLRTGPFRVPRVVHARRLHQPRACLAVHIRVKDRIAAGGNVTVGGVPEAELLGAPAAQVLIRNQWGNLSLAGVVHAAERAASRRRLGLYVLMPYHRPAFEELGRRGAATVQDHNLLGLSELEVMQGDMALAAGCEAFVRDEGSTLSDVVASMMGGVGVLSPRDVMREEEEDKARRRRRPGGKRVRHGRGPGGQG
jgi:hypothetical protein